MQTKLLSLVISAAALAAAPVQAETFTLNLYNTGVDAGGTVLPNGTLGDPHYELISAPVGSATELRVLTAANGYPVGPWMADNISSRWIAPNNGTTLSTSPQGNYVYRTTFDLTGLVPWTTRISGGWATDNNGLDILINGVSIGATTSYTQFSQGFSAFSIASGFVDGINTLDFVVFNDFDATGLRVELSGTASDVPEPGSLALAGLALAGLGLARRRRG